MKRSLPEDRTPEIYDAFEAIDIAIGHARICECESCDAVMFLRRMLKEAGKIPSLHPLDEDKRRFDSQGSRGDMS
jgi:hypothetical protein